ncbi:MAG: polysaccharide deacetylase family protein [Solirubrobacteraceae bacterium]|jgi:peptidoglycan/xylan/chitin deacetylase (PgdA/CDA1 family)
MPQQVALTFDDGPHPTGTRQILEVLDAHAITATFFVWGAHAKKHAEVVREVLELGHSVQPHCWAHRSHLDMTPDGIRADIDAVLTLLRELGVPTPHLWRTPWGQLQTGVSAATARERRLELAGWTIDSTDYAGTSATDMYEQVIRQLGAQKGSSATILMHDSRLEPIQKRSRRTVTETVELVRRLVANHQYTFAPLARGLDDNLDEQPARQPPSGRPIRRVQRFAARVRRGQQRTP